MMDIILRGGRLIDPANEQDRLCDIGVKGGKVAAIADKLPDTATTELDARGLVICPGLIDLHVHFRDPGQTHKEDINTGAAAALAGGFTTVCSMPNTNPTIDTPALISHAKGTDKINILPIGAITKGLKGQELTPIADMAAAGAIGISDDGLSVANAYLMKQGMLAAKDAGLIVFVHCEDLDIANGGVMHEGEASRRLGLKGISPDAEEVIIARDIVLAMHTGARLHICHITSAGGVQLLREAKARGLSVTGEACPHHFILSDEDIPSPPNPNFKMNPPLRSRADVAAIKAGIADGTIDIIATDHAPHAADEKAKGFADAPFGIIGLETALPLSISALVDTGALSLNALIAKLTTRPAQIIGLDRGHLSIGAVADIAVFNPDKEFVIGVEHIKSKSKNSPFIGHKARGEVVYTIHGGVIRHG